MIRFKYINYIGYIGNPSDDGVFQKVNINDAVDFSSIDLDKYFKNVNNYEDFIEFIELKTKCIESKFYFMSINEGKLFIFYSDTKLESFKPFLIYTFENNDFENLFRRIIKPTDDRLSMFSATVNNDYQFIMPLYALKVILEYNAILFNKKKPYKIFNITQKSGKIRKIIAPDEKLKTRLRETNLVFQKMYDHINEDFQVAYKVGKNVKTNAAIHVNHKYVFNIDLRHFYESCSREIVEKYVKKIFENTRYPKEYTDMFLDAILLNNALFVGSPISGCLANRIIAKPVAYIYSICKKYDISFSVYADDMTFSSDKYLTKGFVYSVFNTAFQEYELDSYFKLNYKKSIGASNHKRKITGVVINGDDQLTMPRKFYRSLRTSIHKLSLGDTSINVNEVRGRIAYALMVDDSGKMFNYLLKFQETVKDYRLCSDATMEKEKEKYKGGA